MKRRYGYWSVLLLVLIVMFIAGGKVMAENSAEQIEPARNNSEFVVSSSGTLTDYTGSETAVVVPSTVNGVQVTAIGYGAFYKCSSL